MSPSMQMTCKFEVIHLRDLLTGGEGGLLDYRGRRGCHVTAARHFHHRGRFLHDLAVTKETKVIYYSQQAVRERYVTAVIT